MAHTDVRCCFERRLSECESKNRKRKERKRKAFDMDSTEIGPSKHRRTTPVSSPRRITYDCNEIKHYPSTVSYQVMDTKSAQIDRYTSHKKQTPELVFDFHAMGEYRRNERFRNQDRLANQPAFEITSEIVPTSLAELSVQQIPFIAKEEINNGRYQTLKTYSYSQFHLLKADCYTGLHKAVLNYRRGKNHIEWKSSACQIEGMWFHENVRIHEAGFLTYTLKFPDRSFTYDARSTRFLPENLLLLTYDEFSTFYPFTVKHTDADSLHKGRVKVQLEGNRPLPAQMLESNVTLVESSPFFGFYRHILEILKVCNKIRSDSFPYGSFIEPYILLNGRPQPIRKPPKYIKGPLKQISYDLSSLEPKPKGTKSSLSRVLIFDSTQRPAPEELGLNPKQADALYAALTQEVSLLQGPPGTGKTFVALKIVQALVNNKQHSGPIMILSQTNRALDQFLEGILTFNQQVVRMGGQSQSQKLTDYTKHKWCSRYPPSDRLRRKRYDLETELEQIESDLRRNRYEDSNSTKKWRSTKNSLNSLKDETLAHSLEGAVFIGLTMTGAVKYRGLLEQLKCRIVVVEEAAQVLEPQILSSLPSSCQQLIMIGDHKQLRPRPASFELVENYKFDISFFERLVNRDVTYITLEFQHRMRPEIADLVRNIYPKLKDHFLDLPNVPGMEKNLFFLDHRMSEKRSTNPGFINEHEAPMAAMLAKYLLMHPDDLEPNDVTILTTYREQASFLRRMQERSEIPVGVKIHNTDDYQGEQNKVVILSLVRNNQEGKIGFLEDPRRLCVAISRAQRGLYIFGNLPILSGKSDLWKNIRDTLQTSGNENPKIGVTLTLRCPTHRTKNEVQDPKDFPTGDSGCGSECGFRFPCGHSCPRKCHYDCVHTVCPESITLDTRGPCGHCVVKCIGTEDGRARLGNLKGTKFEDLPLPDQILISDQCAGPCNTKLSCGHLCKGSCGDCFNGRIHRPCVEKCERKLLCGHSCKASCAVTCPPCQSESWFRCPHETKSSRCGDAYVRCQEKCEWKCKHKKCHMSCHDDCLRELCKRPCPKVLTCGHRCIGFCGEMCPNLCRSCDVLTPELFFLADNWKLDTTRFVLLEDCGHCIEYNAMNLLMGETRNGMYCCPRCATPISNSRLYGNRAKKNRLFLIRVKTVLTKPFEKSILDNIIQELEGKIRRIRPSNLTGQTTIGIISDYFVDVRETILPKDQSDEDIMRILFHSQPDKAITRFLFKEKCHNTLIRLKLLQHLLEILSRFSRTTDSLLEEVFYRQVLKLVLDLTQQRETIAEDVYANELMRLELIRAFNVLVSTLSRRKCIPSADLSPAPALQKRLFFNFSVGTELEELTISIKNMATNSNINLEIFGKTYESTPPLLGFAKGSWNGCQHDYPAANGTNRITCCPHC